jgi:hypothetical protein
MGKEEFVGIVTSLDVIAFLFAPLMEELSSQPSPSPSASGSAALLSHHESVFSRSPSLVTVPSRDLSELDLEEKILRRMLLPISSCLGILEESKTLWTLDPDDKLEKVTVFFLSLSFFFLSACWALGGP